MVTWDDKVKSMAQILSDMTGEKWTVFERGTKYELWRYDSQQLAAIEPDKLCYVIGGVLLGKGLRLENYEAQRDQQKIKRQAEVAKAFGIKAGRVLN